MLELILSVITVGVTIIVAVSRAFRAGKLHLLYVRKIDSNLTGEVKQVEDAYLVDPVNGVRLGVIHSFMGGSTKFLPFESNVLCKEEDDSLLELKKKVEKQYNKSFPWPERIKRVLSGIGTESS